MKISEFIDNLEDFKSKYGDLEIVHTRLSNKGSFYQHRMYQRPILKLDEGNNIVEIK